MDIDLSEFCNNKGNELVTLYSRPDFVKIKEKHGSIIWSRGSASSTIKQVKTQTIVNRSADAVFEFMKDRKNQKLIERSVTELETLREEEVPAHDKVRVVRTVYQLKFPLSDRESVVCLFDGKDKVEGKDCRYLAAASVPIKTVLDPKHVLAEVIVSGHVIVPINDKMCKISTIAHVNPHGRIPKFLVNWAAEHRLSSITHLKQLLESKIPE
ncbi:hypothetical protein P9112_012785 [Eukaryota sp. TZLM1-RC]